MLTIFYVIKEISHQRAAWITFNYELTMNIGGVQNAARFDTQHEAEYFLEHDYRNFPSGEYIVENVYQIIK